MIARDQAGTALPWGAVVEVIQATGAILAEAEASRNDTIAAAGAGPAGGTFLSVRLSRLATAANDAIAAAGDGDSAQLRRHLRRFEVLTSAIWTVQQAVLRSYARGSGPYRSSSRTRADSRRWYITAVTRFSS